MVDCSFAPPHIHTHTRAWIKSREKAAFGLPVVHWTDRAVLIRRMEKGERGTGMDPTSAVMPNPVSGTATQSILHSLPPSLPRPLSQSASAPPFHDSISLTTNTETCKIIPGRRPMWSSVASKLPLSRSFLPSFLPPFWVRK